MIINSEDSNKGEEDNSNLNLRKKMGNCLSEGVLYGQTHNLYDKSSKNGNEKVNCNSHSHSHSSTNLKQNQDNSQKVLNFTTLIQQNFTKPLKEKKSSNKSLHSKKDSVKAQSSKIIDSFISKQSNSQKYFKHNDLDKENMNDQNLQNKGYEKILEKNYKK